MDFLLLEDGSSFLALEDGSGFLLLEDSALAVDWLTPARRRARR